MNWYNHFQSFFPFQIWLVFSTFGTQGRKGSPLLKSILIFGPLSPNRIALIYCADKGFPEDSAVKNLPAVQETQKTQVRSLSREASLEEAMATHSSTLAWRIAWREEPGGLQSVGLQSQTRLKWLSKHVCTLCMHLKSPGSHNYTKLCSLLTSESVNMLPCCWKRVASGKEAKKGKGCWGGLLRRGKSANSTPYSSAEVSGRWGFSPDASSVFLSALSMNFPYESRHLLYIRLYQEQV